MTDRRKERKAQNNDGVEIKEGDRKEDGDGDKETQQKVSYRWGRAGQKEIVASLDVGQRNKDCRDRQNQQQDREDTGAEQ